MPYQITCDIHTHTLFSRHAYSTIMENLVARAMRACRCWGLPITLATCFLPSRTSATSSIFSTWTSGRVKRMAWCCSRCRG